MPKACRQTNQARRQKDARNDKKMLEMMAHAWEAVAKERQQQLCTRAENGINR
jgi:hypothetical protein